MLTATALASTFGVGFGYNPQHIREFMRGLRPDYASPIKWSDPVEWGIMHEQRALDLCAKYVDGPIVPANNLLMVRGLWSDPCVQIGASPDAFGPDNRFLVEAKCPYSLKSFERQTHLIPLQYYLQIQQQMFCCDVPECYLILWLLDVCPLNETPTYLNCKEVATLWHVHFDKETWCNVVEPHIRKVYYTDEPLPKGYRQAGPFRSIFTKSRTKHASRILKYPPPTEPRRPLLGPCSNRRKT